MKQVYLVEKRDLAVELKVVERSRVESHEVSNFSLQIFFYEKKGNILGDFSDRTSNHLVNGDVSRRAWMMVFLEPDLALI